MKILDWLSLIMSIGKLILLAIEIKNAHRNRGGRSETS
ncbi:unannotated protein [freshwater metagenome]|uniref:Unannotated protein n=1 Tax=freshwater metagenome TaxID=449393 RepID=A0A6J5YLQ2_9ZZZZ